METYNLAEVKSKEHRDTLATHELAHKMRSND